MYDKKQFNVREGSTSSPAVFTFFKIFYADDGPRITKAIFYLTKKPSICPPVDRSLGHQRNTRIPVVALYLANLY